MALQHLKTENFGILNGLNTPIWFLDLESEQIIWANRTALSQWDATSTTDVAPQIPEAALQAVRSKRHLLAQGERLTTKWRLTDHKIVPCVLTGIVLDDAPAVQVEAQLAAESLDRLALMEQLCDNLPLNIFVKDVNGRYRFANKTTLQGLGLEEAGFSDFEVFPQKVARRLVEQDRHVMAQDRTLTFHERIVWEGQWQDRHIVKLPITTSDGERLLVGSSLDITALEQTKDALQAAKEAADAANAAKSRFIAMMSHEIRNPLNSLLVAIQLLTQSTVDPEHAEIVHMVETSGQHLLALVNDILDFSRLSEGRFKFVHDPVDPATLIASALDIASGLAAQKEITLAPNLPLNPTRPLFGDAARIRQILLNLLNNATRFTPRGGLIQINYSETLHDNHVIARFEVHDNGIGIAPEDHRTIFKAFTQVDQTITRNHEGAGLGLSICRFLVEQMGGSISVTSTPGVGSVFVFEVPLQNTQNTQPLPLLGAKPHNPPPSSSSELKVLIADDNTLSQCAVGRLLERAGFTVVIANNGIEAMGVVHETAPDVILMDMWMPGMDGLEATRRIRGLSGDVGNTPIIALTADASPEMEQACFRAGVTTWMTKPFQTEVLLETIQSCLHPQHLAATQVTGQTP